MSTLLRRADGLVQEYLPALWRVAQDVGRRNAAAAAAAARAEVTAEIAQRVLEAECGAHGHRATQRGGWCDAVFVWGGGSAAPARAAALRAVVDEATKGGGESSAKCVAALVAAVRGACAAEVRAPAAV